MGHSPALKKGKGPANWGSPLTAGKCADIRRKKRFLGGNSEKVDLVTNSGGGPPYLKIEGEEGSLHFSGKKDAKSQ